jgi:hypothetical protein
LFLSQFVASKNYDESSLIFFEISGYKNISQTFAVYVEIKTGEGKYQSVLSISENKSRFFRQACDLEGYLLETNKRLETIQTHYTEAFFNSQKFPLSLKNATGHKVKKEIAMQLLNKFSGSAQKTLKEI